MSIEDVKEAVRQAQVEAENQKKAQIEAEKPAKSGDAGDKRKQDALRQIAEKEVLYRMYIAQLASGKSKGKVLSAQTLKRIEDAAVTLSEEIKDLQLIANPPALEPEKKVGSLSERQLPFGGTSVGKVTGPISGGINVQTPGTTGDEQIMAGPGFKPSKPSKPGEEQISAGPGFKPGKPGKTPDGKKLTREEILARYPIIDALFEQDPELQALLNKYVDPKSKMTLKQFTDELSQAKFNFKYADVIKQRMANKAIYDRLGVDATGNTVYERDIAGIVANLEASAKNLGASVSNDDLNRIATNIYLAGTEARPLVIERALTPYIKLGVSPVTGRPTVSGKAGANYQSLLVTAAANGISESLMPKVLGVNTVDEVLRGLAEGASIRDYEQRFRDYAMNGRSDYVKNMLAQGVNFDVIVNPYRNVMADTLELANPEQIKLDDPTLSMAFGDKEMTLSDFARTLRKDSRWQYTNKAREEVSNIALNVLRDFGFQR
jgi:transcriptional regulator with XRE-family HTH domain